MSRKKKNKTTAQKKAAAERKAKRRTWSPEVKEQILAEVDLGEKTITQIAEDHSVKHLAQISQWRRQKLEREKSKQSPEQNKAKQEVVGVSSSLDLDALIKGLQQVSVILKNTSGLNDKVLMKLVGEQFRKNPTQTFQQISQAINSQKQVRVDSNRVRDIMFEMGLVK